MSTKKSGWFSKKEEPASKKKPTVKETADKAAKEIFEAAEAKAQEKVSGLLTTPDDQTGRTGAHDQEQAKPEVQRDTMPGTRVKDPFQIPDKAYDQERDVVRRVGLHDQYHYVFVNDMLVSDFRNRGYLFVKYNGGHQSGLAEHGFDGTGRFERTLRDYVRFGDMLLMFCPLRMYEEILQADQAQRDRWEMAAQGDFHNKGYRHGVRTFEQDSKTGELKYN